MQAKDKTVVRAYILAREGVQKVRIRADEGVEAYGPMPSTSQVGWYFAGWAGDLLAMQQAEEPQRRGRPVGSGVLAPEDRTKPRSVRLNDARWDKLKVLGTEWLERAIDRARVPDEAP